MKNEYGGDHQNTSYRLTISFLNKLHFPFMNIISDALLQIA